MFTNSYYDQPRHYPKAALEINQHARASEKALARLWAEDKRIVRQESEKARPFNFVVTLFSALFGV